MQFNEKKEQTEFKEISDSILCPMESLFYYEALKYAQGQIIHEDGNIHINMNNFIFALEQMRSFFLLNHLQNYLKGKNTMKAFSITDNEFKWLLEIVRNSEAAAIQNGDKQKQIQARQILSELELRQ